MRKYKPEVILLDLHHLGITYFCGNKNTQFTTDSAFRTMVCVFDKLFAILKVKNLGANVIHLLKEIKFNDRRTCFENVDLVFKQHHFDCL